MATGICRRAVIACLLRSEDFERVLRTRSRAHSVHFAVHHIPDRPTLPRRPATRPAAGELSTSDEQLDHKPVDDSPATGSAAAPPALWFGAVVPKRHARRAVTRSLLKRQIRAAVIRHSGSMARGLWVVRLRAPFERGSYVSAASQPLKVAARAELERLLLASAQPGAAR